MDIHVAKLTAIKINICEITYTVLSLTSFISLILGLTTQYFLGHSSAPLENLADIVQGQACKGNCHFALSKCVS